MIEIITELQKNPLVKWIYVSMGNMKIVEEHFINEKEVRLKVVAARWLLDNEIKIILYGA